MIVAREKAVQSQALEGAGLARAEEGRTAQGQGVTGIPLATMESETSITCTLCHELRGGDCTSLTKGRTEI